MPETTNVQSTTTSSPAAESTATPTFGKPNIFSREAADLSFLDDVTAPTAQSGISSPEKPTPRQSAPAGEQVDPAAVLNEILNETGDENTPTPDAGNATDTPPKTAHGLTEFIRKQITDGRMTTFDDFDETKQTLDQYLTGLSKKDLEELYDANYNARERNSYDQVSKAFFESLPQELQYAYQYVANGGTDLKTLFQSLSIVQETRDLDAEKPEDQEAIYRQYLSAIQFGTAEEITEEINTWKDLGQLDKKAKQAKPKLDKLREQEVSRKLEEQEGQRVKNEQAAQEYVTNVYKALQPGEINGLRLDKKTQSFLYHSMVNAEHTSVTGKPTNLLGHLLEKYQFVEPNYPLITEALWLLSDPAGYRAKLIESGASQHAASTVRTLKTEQSQKQGSQSQQDSNQDTNHTKKIPRPGNIFSRH